MTLTHRSHLVAALLGTALLSCAGGGAREDNQALPPHEPRFAQGDRGPPPPHDGLLIRAPRWRQPMGPQSAPMPMVRMQGGPDRVVLLGQPGGGGPDHQGGPVLGVNVDPSNDGLRVTQVIDTSLAQSAGVKVDDVLLRIGDEHIVNVADVRRALHGRRPGDQVKLAVIRAGEGIVELTGTVPEPPADSANAAGDQRDDHGRSGMSSGDGSRGGFLGVELSETDAPAGGQAGAPAGASHEPGVVIEAVVPNSAAWFAGLDPQDRLLSIDGQALASRADLVGAVASKQPGSLVELKYVRAGQEHTATVRLGQRGPMGLLGSLQDIPGMPSMPSTPGMPGLRGPHGLGGPQLPGQPDQPGPGPFGNMQLRMLDPFDQADLANLLGDMQLQPGASQSLQVEIEGDQMTIERDGKTEHYRRGADGQWQPADGSTPGPDDQSKA